MMRVRGKIETLDLREYMETSLKLVGSQTLIYCGDIFGELDTPGCRPLSQRGWRKRKVLREGNQRGESITILIYGLVLNFDIKCNYTMDKIKFNKH